MKFKLAWIAAALMSMGVLATGCGGNACDDAADHMKECLGSGSSSSSSDSGDCSGVTECAANCINDASCDDIKAALAGNTSNSYFTCASKCK